MSEKTIKYVCKICNKYYKTYVTLWKHNRKFHTTNVTNLTPVTNNKIICNVTPNTKKYHCRFCDKPFNCRQNKYEHHKICKNRIIFNDPEQKVKKYEQKVKKEKTLILNNVIIISRVEDKYINATKLCQAGNKNFNDWLQLDTTNTLIDCLTSISGIPTSQLLNIKKETNTKIEHEYWIHPDLAIQLAHWISIEFSLQVSEWIRTLFINDDVLAEHKQEIKLKDQKIQLLEDTFIKRQKRKNYPDNVIYMITTKENKKDGIYIIGKANIFKNRLSTYNKTTEHEVIHYKQCKSKETMKIIETLILTKLNKYREKANRDRFILPVDTHINLFIDVINSCVKFIDGI
jgi:hypothetical protein